MDFINGIVSHWFYFMMIAFPLIGGWIIDLIFGDPEWLPHPVVGYGKLISCLEHRFNNGLNKRMRGAVVSLSLVLGVYVAIYCILSLLSLFPLLKMLVVTVGVFYCLAGTTLVREVIMVFAACRKGLDAARRQVGRIVGRDTGSLSEQEIKTAALETLAENLSDGVIAPIFWYLILGLPGMMAYKMVNTLDSMIGYRNERYRDFGCFAARMDDVANFVPARLTSFLMLAACGKLNLLGFVRKFGHCHASPNSGYPEAALAGILDCRFGGTHDYFGESVYKPYIGTNPRLLTDDDLHISVRGCRGAEVLMIILTVAIQFVITL